MKNDNDPSVATRAGYLFRTRKSFPTEMSGKFLTFIGVDLISYKVPIYPYFIIYIYYIFSDAQDQAKVDLTGNPLTRQLRSRSYLFRS